MTRPDDVEWRRRQELRSLLTALRSRRGENSGKRLRQDDAAILSGLSTRRYAALERGAVENPSLDLIENVASGLRMTPAERSALHVLSRGQDPPMPPAAPGGERPTVDPGQRELIARLDAPAAITDETWTLVIRNKALTAWTDGWFDRVPPRKQNLVLFLFTPAAERLLPDVHAYRRAIVAGLRYQYVRHIGSDRFGPVIRALLETGPEARDLWGRHEIVLPRRHSAIRVRHDRGTVEASTLMTSLSPRTWLMAAWLPEGLQPLALGVGAVTTPRVLCDRSPWTGTSGLLPASDSESGRAALAAGVARAGSCRQVCRASDQRCTAGSARRRRRLR